MAAPTDMTDATIRLFAKRPPELTGEDWTLDTAKFQAEMGDRVWGAVLEARRPKAKARTVALAECLLTHTVVAALRHSPGWTFDTHLVVIEGTLDDDKVIESARKFVESIEAEAYVLVSPASVVGTYVGAAVISLYSGYDDSRALCWLPRANEAIKVPAPRDWCGLGGVRSRSPHRHQGYRVVNT